MSSLSFSFEEVHGSPSHNSFVPQESTAKDVAGCDPSMSFLPAHTCSVCCHPPLVSQEPASCSSTQQPPTLTRGVSAGHMGCSRSHLSFTAQQSSLSDLLAELKDVP